MKYPRIIVKIGTSTLAHPTGMLNLRRIQELVRVISDIKNTGRELVLVTSGSIGVGAGKLGYLSRPSTLPAKQACAAVGQCELMNTYSQLFGAYNHTVAQVLLTQFTIDHGERELNAVNTFRALLSQRVLPIVNANDTISTKEIEFGDNDTLSAHVAALTKADALLLLTDIDGLYDSNPSTNPNAKLIPFVNKIDEHLKQIASGRGSSLGTGGMITKLQAAEIAGQHQIPTFILNGQRPEALYDIIEGKNPGTLIQLADS